MSEKSLDARGIGCLERRIGRRLTPRDFTCAPINDPNDPWDTPRLHSRKDQWIDWPPEAEAFLALLRHPLQYDKRDKHLAAYMQQRQRAIDALIKRGRFFTPVKRPKGFRLGRLKACCCNAARIAIGNGIDGRGQYVEGYAMSSGSGFIAKHAWLTTDGSNAIDVTWRDPALADFGIVYDTKVLARTIMG